MFASFYDLHELETQFLSSAGIAHCSICPFSSKLRSFLEGHLIFSFVELRLK